MNTIEKVANAIYERRNANNWPCEGLDFDKEMAKAAIKALKEPDEAIIIIGNRCLNVHFKDRYIFKNIWENIFNFILL